MVGLVRESADDVVSDQPTGDQHEEADDHKPPADARERLPPLSARQVDRQRVKREDGHEEPDAQDPRQPHAVLRGVELVRAHDRDRAGVGRELREGLTGQAELLPDLLHQREHVERDDPVPGRDPVAGLVLEHVDELLVREVARLDEARLEPRLREQELDPLGRRLAHRRGGRVR